MTGPDWFGTRYPGWNDLHELAASMGIDIQEMETPRAFQEGRTIVIPLGLSPLARIWALAHEVGHARMHPAGPRQCARSKQETQANRWAASALIPEARIQAHQNACMDAFIAALSVHYEDIPFENCATRRLAARIAKYRLEALSVEIC